MRKLIYSINVTIDGVADHTAVIADDELHDFYTDLLGTVDIVLFGRKTYQLMESFWPVADQDPRTTKSMIRFADKFNSISKIVFSKTLDKAAWNNTTLIKENAVEEVSKLKQQTGKHLSVGGISLASALMKAGLIDEYWFLVQPIISGKGRQLFEEMNTRHDLQLLDTIKFNSGVTALHYKKGRNSL